MSSEQGEPSDHQLSFKFVLVGDSAVGKTAMCKQFCDHSFNANQPQTVGLEFGTRIVEVESFRIKLQIWDTAGQERFHSITRAYFRSSAAVFLVFDVTNRESFNHLGTWVEDATQLSPKTAIKVLVGNKTDLDAQRQVSTAEAKDFADQHGLTLFETSALSGDRIDDTFIETAHAVLDKINSGEIELNNPVSGARAPLSAKPQPLRQDPSGGNSCC
ncbi:Ras family protein [Tritrichomonas foetus]|uniref:Ras family protein n=1 Tax=Tritrichomonas foetus TaxID=1144522 RepID=A0A1J4KB86_9EUKA|nr:Ras family protein [Tritrichomonas foetus]|eukprot:OHT06956.1 Ras family protein [Tritrichomonas foetus]